MMIPRSRNYLPTPLVVAALVDLSSGEEVRFAGECRAGEGLTSAQAEEDSPPCRGPHQSEVSRMQEQGLQPWEAPLVGLAHRLQEPSLARREPVVGVAH